MADWIRACAADEIDEEDVIRFDHGERTFAVYNTEKGFFATDGICTHKQQHLEDGVVIGMVIECPLHQGRFEGAFREVVFAVLDRTPDQAIIRAFRDRFDSGA